MGYVSVLKCDVVHIDEKEFLEWLNSKDDSFWDEYGLSRTGKYPDQNDEADVKSFVSRKIQEFNDTKMINSEQDIGCLLSLCDMISKYLIERYGAINETIQELSSETHVTIVRK